MYIFKDDTSNRLRYEEIIAFAQMNQYIAFGGLPRDVKEWFLANRGNLFVSFHVRKFEDGSWVKTLEPGFKDHKIYRAVIKGPDLKIKIVDGKH